MRTAMLRLELLSAATFGRGDGVAGLVDREIEHDQDGFPFLRGRALKGLLAESAEDLMFAFQQQDEKMWGETKIKLFGKPGSGLNERGTLHVGDAKLPEGLRRLLLAEMSDGTLKRDDLSARDQIFAALTGIRRQTAMNYYGAPDRDSLRSMRVILRGCIFEAELVIDDQSNDDLNDPSNDRYWALLAGAALGLRRAGTGRNRGRGYLRASLIDETTTRKYFEKL